MTSTNSAKSRYDCGFCDDSIDIKFSLSRLLRRLLFVTVALSGLLTSGCAQVSEQPIAADEVSVEFRHVAKRADVKKSVVALSDIPKAPQTPQTYRIIENRVIKIESETIDLGDLIVTLKVPTKTEADFGAVKVLRLVANELRANGFEWQDCTVSVETLTAFELLPTEPDYLPRIDDYKQVHSKHLPNYAQRQVSCELKDRMKSTEYLVVVRQVEPVPTKIFTRLEVSLDSKSVAANGDVSYLLDFRNAGPKDIAELTYRSNFDLDTSVVSAKPDSGKCVRSDWGTRDGSFVCFAGRLAANTSTKVRFEGVRSAGFGIDQPAEQNKAWQIRAVIWERENDPTWVVNRLYIEPLANENGASKQKN
jgi:hypothetical protein